VVKLAALDFHPKTAASEAPDSAETKLPRAKHGPDDAIVLKRNLFGATDIDVESSDSPAPGGADLRLRGIASLATTAFAVFENTASGEQNVFRVGDRVFDGPKLVTVDATGAEVLLRGKKRRYEIEEENTVASVEESHGSAKHGASRYEKSDKSDKTGKGGKDKGATSGVRKTGENAYLVDRKEVEHVVANLNEVITQARAVPVITGGKSNGFKLFSIRPGSIFEKVGLHDGDIVQRVNDTELTDPSKAVGLLEEIQSVAQVRVNFVRSGKLHTYTYTIR
jgi:general secretion pathway protein C